MIDRQVTVRPGGAILRAVRGSDGRGQKGASAMDPEQAYRDLHQAIHTLDAIAEEPQPLTTAQEVLQRQAINQATVAFMSLDLWLKGGGFLPQAWQRNS